MEWKNLLFAHWSVDPDAVRKLLPAGLELDLFQNHAWIGVVPFEMVNTRPRICPPISYFSDFPELNIRTYVVKDEKPGVWFFSLDAGSKFVVRAARKTYNLPYFDAAFEIERTEAQLRYRSDRTHRNAQPAALDVSYFPTGEIFQSIPGTLEHWLTARYCLYAARGDKILRGEIDHLPWNLQTAQADFENCDMTRICGFELEGNPASLLYSDWLKVHAWALA